MADPNSSPDIGLTPKQAAFALAYFETGSGAEAYRQAYDVSENARDEWIYVEASQLLDNPKVARRVQELQKQAETLSMYSVKQAYDELEEARKAAKTVGNPSAMVSAINSKMKLFGLEQPTRTRIDHSSKDGTMSPAKPQDVTPETVQALVDKLTD